ncbi:GNAT family N-acetyltransferase [Streptomyces sp. NPDC001046]|uniref:GNAT family N-acetyltransferase n=1 Tax=Streptomyces sp. NPDC001046 TaxID=3364543 RepID=UPI0036B41060
MDTTGKPLFCDVDLAARIERAEVELISQGSTAAHRRQGEGPGFLSPVMGGVASFAEDDSPLNKVAGLGFGGVPDDGLLDEVERAFAERGAPVQVELAHLADPEIGARLTERGYRLTSFENVLGFPLPGEHPRFQPDGIEIRPSGDAEFEEWLDTIATGFAHPDTQGVASHEEFPREVIAAAIRDLVSAAGMRRYSAVSEGVVVGGAGLRMTDGIAQLTGAATVPSHRRRGVQTALLAARLAEAAAAGCDLAVVTTRPGSTSQQNVQRQGFHLLYTRAVLVKQAEHGGE